MYDSLQSHGKIAVDEIEIGMELQDVFDTEGKFLLSPVTITRHDQIESLRRPGVGFAYKNRAIFALAVYGGERMQHLEKPGDELQKDESGKRYQIELSLNPNDYDIRISDYNRQILLLNTSRE